MSIHPLRTCEHAKFLYQENFNQLAVEDNAAIQQEKVPPKSKIPGLVPRIATNLQDFNDNTQLHEACNIIKSPLLFLVESLLECRDALIKEKETEEVIKRYLRKLKRNFDVLSRMSPRHMGEHL
ncbi:hypothetical protein ACROYT_G015163 [Oculina patagonica]